MELEVSVLAVVEKSNIDEWVNYLTKIIEGINENLLSEEEFGKAQENSNKLKKLQSIIEKQKLKIIEKIEEINIIFRKLDQIINLTKEKRFVLDKAIKNRKYIIKTKIIDENIKKIENIYQEIGVNIEIDKVKKEIIESLKYKRTIKTVNDAADKVTEKYLKKAETMINDDNTYIINIEFDAEIEKAKEIASQIRERMKAFNLNYNIKLIKKYTIKTQILDT